MPIENYPNISEQVIAELDQLFESSPPAQLKKSILTLLFQYLRGTCNLEGEEFHRTMNDIWYLIEFLEESE